MAITKSIRMKSTVQSDSQATTLHLVELKAGDAMMQLTNTMRIHRMA
jgi:ribosomal protein L29